MGKRVSESKLTSRSAGPQQATGIPDVHWHAYRIPMHRTVAQPEPVQIDEVFGDEALLPVGLRHVRPSIWYGLSRTNIKFHPKTDMVFFTTPPAIQLFTSMFS